MKKHQKRKGVGCRYEEWEEGDILLCTYCEHNFGQLSRCCAPKECWMDIKITNKFDDHIHCPNCSRINEPFKLVIDDEFNSHCEKCKFSSHLMKVD